MLKADTKLDTIVRASKLYLRALRREKHGKTHQDVHHLTMDYFNKKIQHASRFTPYFNF